MNAELSPPAVRRPRILVGVTGSIAAYKSCDLVSQLVKDGYEVRVVMTESAARFITPLTLETLSRQPVHLHPFESSGHGVEHIALARWADVMCVAPASADFICKYAAGIADNLLLTELLAFEGPVLLAPAMNHSMFRSPPVREACRRLRQRGVLLQPPASGELACGENGIGKMTAVETLVHELTRLLAARPLLAGKTVLITAGPTRAYLDAVRFLSNPSSGKMGFALAQAARVLGATVELVTGPTDASLYFPGMCRVETAGEMHREVIQRLPRADLFIGAAAVNDFTLGAPATGKIHRDQGTLTVSLVPEVDILGAVAAAAPRPSLVIGFAAEVMSESGSDSAELRARGQAKLARKGLDYIVVNQVFRDQRGFAVDNNRVMILSKRGTAADLAEMPKTELAFRLLAWIHEDHQAAQRLSQPGLQLS